MGASAPSVRAQPAALAVVPIPLVAADLSVSSTPTLAPVGPDPTTSNGGGYTMDVAYVDAVDKAASEQGVKVIWVHPPQKRQHN